MATVIPSEGLARIASLINDDSNFIGVGSNNNPPVSSDSQLVEETNRAAIASKFLQNNKAQFRALFINSSLPTVTEEMGLFLDGNGSPNTGHILVRATEQFTKLSADLLIIFEVTAQEQT